MALAKHLTVLYGGVTAFAPRCHMVGIHLVKLPDAMVVIVVTNGAIRAIRHSFFLCLCGLLLIHLPHRGLVKDSNIKQFCVFAVAKHILKDATMIGHKVISHKFLNLCREFHMIIRLAVETLI